MGETERGQSERSTSSGRPHIALGLQPCLSCTLASASRVESNRQTKRKQRRSCSKQRPPAQSGRVLLRTTKPPPPPPPAMWTGQARPDRGLQFRHRAVMIILRHLVILTPCSSPCLDVFRCLCSCTNAHARIIVVKAPNLIGRPVSRIDVASCTALSSDCCQNRRLCIADVAVSRPEQVAGADLLRPESLHRLDAIQTDLRSLLSKTFRACISDLGAPCGHPLCAGLCSSLSCNCLNKESLPLVNLYPKLMTPSPLLPPFSKDSATCPVHGLPLSRAAAMVVELH